MKYLRACRQSLGTLMVLLMLSWQIGQPLQAATFYWDADANATNNDSSTGADLGGAAGTWDTTTSNWWGAISGSDEPWNNANNNTAVFWGTAGTVTLGTAITAGALQFKSSGYTLTGNSLALTGTGEIMGDLGTYSTIASQLNGTNGLTLAGSNTSGRGAVRLTHSANSYTGTTTINSGTLIIDSNGALGTDTSTVVINEVQAPGLAGGSLMLAGNTGAATYATGFTVTRNLSMNGTGTVVQTAPYGTAILSVGNNTISGLLTGAPGTTANHTGAASAFGTLTLSNVALAGTSASFFTTLGATSSIGSININGTLAGTGSIQKVGSSTLLLAPTDATGFNGILQITTGTVRVTDTAALGVSAATNAIDLNGGTLELRTDSTAFASAKRINLNNGGGADLFLDRGIGGNGLNQTFTFANYDYDGDETLVINSRNGYGATFTAATALGNSNTAVAVTNNGNGLVTYGGTLWGQSSSSANSLTINGTGNTLLTGSITATGGNDTFVKSGTGTVTVQGTAGTYLGATTISGGALVITDFRTLNGHNTGTNTSAINIGSTTTAGILTIGTTTAATAAGLTLLTGKSINLNGTTGGATINANQTFAAPVIIGSMTVTGAGIKSLTLGGTSTQNNIISGVIADNGGATSLIKADGGVWVLSGINTYTGNTTITGGTLKVQSNAATTSTIVVNTSAVIFDVNAATLGAGGALQLIGFTTNNATTESFGALTPTAGAATITTTLGTGGAAALANISFASLGTVASGTGVNFVTGTANANGSVTIGSSGTSTATTLPGNGHFYINGADFARANGNVMVTPSYGVDAGFTAINTITAATHTAINTTTTTTAGAALTLSSIKIMGNTSAFTLASSQTLTISTGGILATGATGASITGGTGITTGGAGDMVIRVDGTNDKLTLSTPLTSTTTGGLTKNGAGTLVINAANAQTGGLTINEGTVQLLSGTIGANAASATTANLNIRQGGSLDLNGVTMSGTPIGQFNGAGTVKNTSATAATFTVGSSNGTGTFSGIIDQTAGVINITKAGTGAQTWSGLSTYTGVTTIGSTGIVSVATLANLGTASSIGKGNSTGADQAAIDVSNAGSLVFNGTTGGIAYVGTTSVSIDRLFTMSGGGQITNNSANNSTLIFNKSNAIAFGTTASQTLTLGGSSTGDNQINLKLTNPSAGTLGLSKIGAGLWILGNATNNNTGTTQIGLTTVGGGVLQAVDGSTLSNNSYLLLGGTTGGGIFQSSGTFLRNVGTAAAANTVSFNSTLTTGAVGFAASDSKLVVALGGLATPTALTWGSGGFMGVTGTSTGALALSSIYALSEVEFRNAINLNGVNRTILVDDNTTTFTDFATITGVISNSGATAGINKSGTGMLQLLGANTYTGNTAVQAGTLVVNSLGLSTAPGPATATSVGMSNSGGVISLGSGTTTTGTLVYVGPGETSDRGITFLGTTTAAPIIVADGTGPLVLTGVFTNSAGTTKALTLRGTNNFANQITSVLANNGANALSVTHDSTGTWILSGVNTYTGATSVSSAGSLGAGNDQAFGVGGALTITNGTIFAYGGDRTIANPITLGNSTNSIDAYVGDFSLTFNGNVSNGTTSVSSRFTRNNIVAGKTLTFNGAYTFNGAVTGTSWNFDGSGDTIINGLISQASTGLASTSVVGFTYSGTGSLTLGNTGNAYLGTTTISSGTLKVGAGEVIPDGVTTGSATTSALSNASTTITAPTAGLYPGMTISGPGIVGTPTIVSITDGTAFVASAAQTVASGATLSFSIGRGGVVLNPAAGVTATLDLGGNNETINALTATSGGNAVIDNSWGTPASLTFGANNQVVSIAPAAGGTFTISNTGGGALSITKTGTASMTIPSTGVTLSYTGATSVTGGTMTIAAPLTGTTALSSTGTGSNLNLIGGLTAPGAITSVIVGGGAFLSLLDGAGTPLSNLSVLNLGAGSGIATLSLELGTLSDTITVNSAAVMANTIRLNLSGISGLQDGTDYSLLVAPSGLSAGTYVLGSQPGGFSSGILTVTDTLVKYTTGSAIVGNLIWNNTQTTGSWATNNAGATNFTTDLAGTTDGTFTPGPGTTVIFGTTALTGGPAFTTSLDANFTVAGLQFTANPANVTSWTINAGTPATSNLTIKGGGIDVANNAGAVTINANVILGAAQSWNVNGGGANGSSLTVASIISGNGFVLSKTGAGILNLSGVNTFNGGLTIKAGTVIGTVSASVFGPGTITLGDTSGSNSAALQINTTGLTYANAIALAAGGTGTLEIGTPVNAAAVNTTFSGGLTGTNNLTINNQSVSGTTTFSINALNNSGTITNSSLSTGAVTISGGIGSNVTGVTLNSTTSALTISTTALTVNSVATTLTNAAGTSILTLSGGTTGTGHLILNNNSARAAGITVSTLAVNHTGTITNSGSGTGDATISAVIGTNVTGVIQNSPTSMLILSGVNTFTGGITIKSGILRFSTPGTSVGGSGNTITIGDSFGTEAAMAQFQSSVTYDAVPITVAAGSSGTLTLSGSSSTGAPVVTGAITLNNNLTVGNTITGVTTGTLTLQGGITGTGDLTISSASTSTGVITISTGLVNMTGSITNASVGATGAVTISSVIGAAVTSVTQNSATSSLTLSGANTAFRGAVNLVAGTLNIRDANALGATGLGGAFTISGGVLNNNLTATPIVNLANNSVRIDGDFTFTGTSSLNLGTGAGNLGTSAGTTRTITVSASTLTLGGLISNGVTANSLNKAGAGTLALLGNSTFTGGVTVTAGTLQFNTVSNNGGAASSLGRGTDGLTLSGGTLSFTGSTSQSTDRAVTLTAATNTLSADGTGGATITYSGAFVATTVADVTLVLTGSGDGFITSTSFVPSLGTGDLTKNGTGTWTISGTGTKITDDDLIVNAGTLTLTGGGKAVDDDVVVEGAGAILNLNSTGVLIGNSSTSAGLYSRNGAVININADDAYNTSTGLDYIILGDNAGTGTLNTNTFNITTPRLDLGQDGAGFIGSIIGSGTVTVGTSIHLFQGTIAATASLMGAGNLYKLGGGTVTLFSGLTGLTGATGPEIHSGTLNLDYTQTNAAKFLSTTSLRMSGGTLLLTGNASADTFETVAGLILTSGSTGGNYPTLTGGSSALTLAAGGSQHIALSLGDITRTVGGSTIRFNLPTGAQNATNGFITTQANTNGIIGGFATVYDGSTTSFATNLGGNIVGVAMTAEDTVTSWITAQNITDSAGFTGTLVTNTNITSLRFNAAGPSTVTINAGVVLNLSSGGILQTSNVTGGVSTIAGGRLTSGAGNDLIFNVDSATQRLDVTSQITGLSLVTKGGAGTLRLNSANNFYSGITSVLGGTLQVSGGGAIGDNSTVIVGGGQTSTLELLANETVGSLSAGGENGSTAGAGVVSSIKLNGNTLIFNQGTAVTMAGVLFTSTNAGVLVKSGSATWTNQASNPGFTGTFRVDQGLAVFSGNFTQLSAAIAVVLNGSGSSLRMDQDQTSGVNRIANGATITLNNTAGITADALGFYVRRNGGTSAASEQVGQLILGAGHNTIASDGTASTTSVSTINFSNATPLVRNNLATLFVVGRALGDGAVTQRGSITFSVDPGGAIGGGGSSGSTFNIYPYIVGESTAGALDGSVNFGNSFVRYVSAAVGLKPLDLTAEYVVNQAAYDALGAGVLTNNVRFTATTTTLASDTTGINSLVLDSATGITLNGPVQSLAITSGAILSAGAGANAIAGFNGITTGANPYYVYVTNPLGTLTLTAPLTTGQALVKSGAGTLIMNSTNNAFTDLYFNQGVVRASSLSQLGVAGASNFNFFGGTLQFTGVFDPSSTKTLTFGTGGGTLDTNGNDIVLANAAAATSIGMNGAGGLIKTGTKSLTLAAQAAYAGSTAIQNGTIIVASGANDRLPTTTALVLGTGSNAGVLQLGNGTGASNQTVGELSVSGSAGGSNAIVGGDTAISILTVNQGTQTTYAGSIGGVGTNQNNVGITKSGIGSLTLSGSTLSYVGPTSVIAGDLNITGSTGALLNTSAVNVNAGATLNLLNGVGQIINLGAGALSLGSGSGTTVLGLELGSTSAYDHIATTGAATTANLVLFNLTNLAGFGAGNYDLLSAAGGGLSGATYALGAAALGGVSLHLNTSDTLVQLAVTAITGDLYWKGAVGSSWTAFNGQNSNFTTDLAGTINAQGIPGTNNGVIFSASSQTNTALNTSLNANFFIRDLTFNNNVGSGPLDTISIGEGSGGTLTITPTVSTAGIDIQTGAPGTISITAPIILGASQTWTVADAASVLAVSGGISGTGNLIKAGAGMLTLTGTNNYVGTTTVSAGVLRANAANTFNAASAYTIGATGTLRLNGFAQTVLSLAGAAGAIVENGAATGNVVLTVGDSSNTLFAGIIRNGAAATLGLTKTGTGALTLSGANTYTGNTIVSAGTLNVTGSIIGNAASSVLAFGGSATNTIVNVSGNMTLFSTTGSNVSGGVAVYNQTAGTVNVTGNTTSAVYIAGAAGSYGYFNLTGGTFKDSNRFALSVSSNLATQATAVAYIGGSGLLDLTGSEWMLNYSHGQMTVADSGVVDRTGATQPFGLMMNSTVAGSVYGVLNIAGGSFLTTTQSIRFGNSTTAGAGNNNTALINIAAGTLQVGIAMSTSLPSAGANNAYINFAGGTLKTSAAVANWIPTAASGITFTTTLFGAINNSAVSGAPSFAGGMVFDTNGFNSSLSNVLGGATGSGVAQSSLSVTGGTGYIGAPEVVFTGGTLAAGGTPASGYALISGGAVVGIVITSPGTYTTAPTVTLTGGGGSGASVTVGALVANTSGGLTKNGLGTLTLSGANTYTGGTTVNAGTLALGANNALADAGGVTINGGTFDVAGFSDTVGAVSLQSGTVNGSTGVLTSTTDYDLRSGTVNFTGAGGFGGSMNVTKTTAGTVTLTGNGLGVFTRVVNVNGGTLAFSASNQLGNAAVTNTLAVNGGTLSYTGAAAADLTANRVLTVGSGGATLDVSSSTGVLTISGGVASGSTGNLTKTGTGMVVISGTTNLNSGGGTVTVSGGTLRASFGTGGIGALTVSATGTLSLQNGVAEALTLANAPGSLNLAGGARLGFELGTAGMPGASDLLQSLNAVNVGGTIIFDFYNLGGFGAGTYNLIAAGSGLDSASYVLGSAPSGYNYVINKIDTLVSVTVVAFQPRYWTNSQATGSWSTVNAGPLTNWATDAAGTTNATDTPSSLHTVVFSASSLAGPAISTTLDGDYTIDSLQFTGTPSGVTSVTIARGASGTLTLAPVSTVGGIEVQNNAGTVTISAPLVAATAQTWSVSNVGASLVVSGNTTFTGSVNKTGAGALTLSGSNSGTGTFTLTAGTLNLNSATALGSGGGSFIIGAGTTINNSSGGAVVLSNTRTQTWNGNFTFTGTQSLNLGSGAVTLANDTILTVSAQTLTVGGGIGESGGTRALSKAGTGTLVLNGSNTYDGLTTVSAGVLTLVGDNSAAGGGVTLTAGTLNINHANALGTGTLTLAAASIINNTLGSLVTNAGNNLQIWNGSFTFTGTNSLNLGSGAVTLNASATVTTSGAATTLTVGGVIDDGANTFNLTKNGAGTLTLSGLSSTAASNYSGSTILDGGTLAIASTASLAGALTFGTAAGTNLSTLNLANGSATFGGTMTVQTNSATANIITIGSGQTLRLNGAVLVGAAGNTTTALTANGLGTLTIGAAGAATNANVSLGGNVTTNVSNGATWDMSGLAVFYANLGTGTLRIGDLTNSGGTATKGSTLILAADSTILATTITQDSPDGGVTQAIKLGSGTNVINANTIVIGAGASGRSSGTFGFNTSTGTLKIRSLADTVNGRATLDIANTATTQAVSPVASFDTTGHSADIRLGLMTVGARTGAAAGNATGTFSFDTGTLDVNDLLVGNKTVATTGGNATGTVNLGGTGTTVINNATGPVQLGVNAANNGVSSGTLNVSGGSVTIAASGGNSIRLGQATVAGGAATGEVNITGGTLTVAGDIIRGSTAGTSTATVTLSGGTLNMSGNFIGSAVNQVTFNAESGRLQNLGQLNGGAALTKTTTGTLILDTANSYTGVTNVSAGVLAISHGGALGGTTNGTSVAASGTLSMSGDITVTGESLSLAAGAGGSATLNNQTGSNTWTGNVTVDTGSDGSNRAVLNSDAGKLTVSGNVTLSGTQDFVLRGDGNGEISGQITGSQRLFKSSVGTGTWILSGDNSSTFTGRATVGNGVLQIASESNLGATPGAFVANHLTLGSGSTNGSLKTTSTTSLSANRGVTLAAGGGTFETAATTTLTVNSVVTGTGTLTKEGAGALIFTAANTNTGLTTVNAGILGGTGAVGGNLTVANNGTLAPGITGAGQFTVAGNLSVSSGGTLLMQIGGRTANDADAIRAYYDGHSGSLAGLTIQPGYENYVVNTTAHDNILVNGADAPVINGTLKLDSFLPGYVPAYGDIFDLLDWTNVGSSITGVTGATFDFSSVPLSGGLGWNTDLFASQGIIVVVPEPSRALFLMLGLLGLMIRRRRSMR